MNPEKAKLPEQIAIAREVTPGMPGPDVTGDGKQDAKSDADPDKQAERLEHEIEQLRDNIGGLVSELSHRGHRLNPAVAIKNHPLIAALTASIVIGAVAGGGVLWHRAHVRRRDSWTQRTKRLRKALKRAVAKPEKVAEPEPNVGMKVLSAAATAVAVMVARKLAGQLLQPSPSANRAPVK